jgi:hypothetical protein
LTTTRQACSSRDPTEAALGMILILMMSVSVEYWWEVTMDIPGLMKMEHNKNNVPMNDWNHGNMHGYAGVQYTQMKVILNKALVTLTLQILMK